MAYTCSIERLSATLPKIDRKMLKYIIFVRGRFSISDANFIIWSLKHFRREMHSMDVIRIELICFRLIYFPSPLNTAVIIFHFHGCVCTQTSRRFPTFFSFVFTTTTLQNKKCEITFPFYLACTICNNSPALAFLVDVSVCVCVCVSIFCHFFNTASLSEK